MAKESSVIRNFAHREFLAVFFVVVNALSWYFPLYALVTDTINRLGIEYATLVTIFGVHYAAVIVSALIGMYATRRVMSRRTLLYLWMIVGVASTALVGTLGANSQPWLLMTALAVGISLGLGFPSCLAYFAEYGVTEQRGRIGGLTYCIAGLGIFFVGLVTVLSPSLLESLILLAGWRLAGLIILAFVQPHGPEAKQGTDVSYRDIVNERSFMLYLVPWLMFCLVNYLESPMLSSLMGPNVSELVPVTEFGVGSIVALVGGFFSDAVGRKRVLIFGFVMLGIGYATLSLSPRNVVSWYLYIAVDGVAWGILALMFFLILWGELAENRVKDKYYFLGVLPFMISGYLGTIASPLVTPTNPSSSFSLASFFLFVAVLPLMYAPETLPQKNIELKRLRSYLESAKNLRKKASEEK